MIPLLRKTALRWALIYLLLFGASAGVVLGFVYWRTATLILARTDAAIAADMAYFAAQYEDGGPASLLEAVAGRARSTPGAVYQLTDFTGRPLAGNLGQTPTAAAGASGVFEFIFEAPVAGGFSDHPVRARAVVLTGGLRLIAGRDIEPLHQVQAFLRQALAIAVVLALFLGLAAGYFMSRHMLRRIGHISRTSRAIRSGRLDERIPLTGSGDEFDNLARELNAMLDRINRLMREMREVSDNIAHDLKSPLARLQAGLEDALRSGGEAAGIAAMQSGVAEASGLLETVEALLSISRAEAGAGREQMQELELSPLLAGLAELYEPAAEEAGLALTTRLDGAYRVRANRQIITQAVSNLLDNAVHHAASAAENGASRLEISLESAEGFVRIIVADNGPGIPEADRERVKKRFVRLDPSRSSPGAGLGLSIVAAAARLHEGGFFLEDNQPGLRAVISLPLL